VKILDTAISSAELADVTAMKINRSVHTAPPFPRRTTAALGSTKPALTSASGMRSGKEGNDGWPSSARQASPIVVAQSHGMANHERPPRTYPGSAETGDAAMALL